MGASVLAAGAGAGVAAGLLAGAAAGLSAGFTVTEPAGVVVVVAAAGAGAGVAGAAVCVTGGAVKSLSPLLALCFLDTRVARLSVTMNRAAASQPVPFCRTFVVWAPHIWLATPSPKAAPRPSCRGRCMRMMRTRSRQTSTSTMVSNVMRMSIKGRAVWSAAATWQVEGWTDAEIAPPA